MPAPLQFFLAGAGLLLSIPYYLVVLPLLRLSRIIEDAIEETFRNL